MLDLATLSRKLVSLLALTTAQRVQSIVGLHLDYMQDLHDKVIFKIPELMKTSRHSCPYYTVALHVYSFVKLCVVRTLRQYIQQTSEIRKSEQLIVSFKTGKVVGTSTVSRWIKQTLQNAGININIFKSHSV